MRNLEDDSANNCVGCTIYWKCNFIRIEVDESCPCKECLVKITCTVSGDECKEFSTFYEKRFRYLK